MNKEFTFLQEEDQQEAPWLPLSPPLKNKEQPPPVSTNHSGVNTWHSLWSSSTWQNDQPKRTRSLSLVPAAADPFTSPLPPFQSTGFMINQSLSNTDKSIWSYNLPEERRHSIAYFARPITPPPQETSVPQLIQQLQRQQQQINEYFSPTTSTVDVQYLGKGISIDQIKSDQPIYQIQFKENYRTDYFYVQQQELSVDLDDMVIVEADRGYDLGKVISIVQDKSTISTSFVKRIFRHANPAELSTHALKKQDEEKALIICQAKIKQKNLNMQVIDAEYQW